jgi:heme exporter protein D
MNLRCKFGAAIALWLALALVCIPVRAQWLRTVPQTPMQQRRAERQLRRQQRLNAMRPGNPNGPMPRVFERLQDMPPERQEKFLENNQRFQNLPSKQQALIRRRLQAWNRLTPEQQQEFRARQLVWEQMTPQQQREVRQTLLPRWQQLPPPRRQAILQRLHSLRDLNESQRQTKLNDPAFLEGLNEEDRETLKQLARLRVGMAAEPAASQD